MKNMKPKDWITHVLKDLQLLLLKKLLDKAVEEKAFEELNQKKRKHSKVTNLNHSKLKMQKYLKANKNNITVEEAQMIFKLRTRMLKQTSEISMKCLNVIFANKKKIHKNIS